MLNVPGNIIHLIKWISPFSCALWAVTNLANTEAGFSAYLAYVHSRLYHEMLFWVNCRDIATIFVLLKHIRLKSTLIL